MKSAELADTASDFVLPEEVREGPLSRSRRKTALSLKDAARESRKKEASKPIYLIRYE